MAKNRPSGLPANYNLSEVFYYGRGSVEIYTDGEYLIFVSYSHDDKLGWYAHTMSHPAKIGNTSE